MSPAEAHDTVLPLLHQGGLSNDRPAAGALPTDGTRSLRFDLGDGVACESVGRLMLEGITACKGGGIDPAKCLAQVTVSSRAGLPFDL